MKKLILDEDGSISEAARTLIGYLLRNPRGEVAHVGRTKHRKGGLRERIKDHLAGKSSFTYCYLNQDRNMLRSGYTFQYLEVECPGQVRSDCSS